MQLSTNISDALTDIVEIFCRPVNRLDDNTPTTASHSARRYAGLSCRLSGGVSPLDFSMGEVYSQLTMVVGINRSSGISEVELSIIFALGFYTLFLCIATLNRQLITLIIPS